MEANRWTVLANFEQTGVFRHRFLCVCVCGTVKDVDKQSFLLGKTRSCGCLRRTHPNHLIHGAAIAGKTWPEYSSWVQMKMRCSNPRNIGYELYGGRGITVCERWLNSFQNFITDMGRRPEGCTLERKENDKGYSPDNCCWATKSQQANNRRQRRWWRRPSQ